MIMIRAELLKEVTKALSSHPYLVATNLFPLWGDCPGERIVVC
jgi:hypothetical protein